MAEIFEAVTKDNTVSEIAKVKVRRLVYYDFGLTKEQINEIKTANPGFVDEVSEMYRLELIDEEISKLSSERDAIQAMIDEKNTLRGKIEIEAKKVKLKNIEEEPK